MWDRNLLRVERLPRIAPARRAAAEADAVLGGSGLPHRKLVCDVPELGERLARGLEARGWRASSLAVMVWAGGPVPGGTGRELAEAEARALHEAQWRVYEADPETAAQLARAGAGRVFGAPAEAPVALARLLDHGTAAEIDDVAVLPEARGRGWGTAVVLAALAVARAEVVFLRADERDWPWAWYARLGFEVVGRQWSFVLPGA